MTKDIPPKNCFGSSFLQGLPQPINILLQVFNTLLHLLFTGVLSFIHLLATAVHHLGVCQSPGLRLQSSPG